MAPCSQLSELGSCPSVSIAFFAISVLVGTMLQYLDMGTLQSIITVDGAFRISTELMVGDALTICCVLKSTGAVNGDSSWTIGPPESIIIPVSQPLWRLRISPTGGILLITEISDCRGLISSA